MATDSNLDAQIDIVASTAETSTTAPGEFQNHYVITKSESKRAKWYIIHTYSGHETRVAVNMIQRVESMDLAKNVLEILIPTQNKIQIKRGKKQSVKEKLFI